MLCSVRRSSFIWAFKGLSDCLQLPRRFISSIPSNPNFSFLLQKDFQGVLFIYFFISQVSTFVGYKGNSVVCIICIKECEKVFWRGGFSDYMYSLFQNLSECSRKDDL